MMPVRNLLWLAIVALAVLAPFGALNPTRAQDAPPKAEPKGDKGEKSAPLALGGVPQTPAERDSILAGLYGKLAAAEDETEAKAVEENLERVWLHSGSPTVDLLFGRAMKAVAQKDYDQALVFFDHVVEQAPDFTEAWSRRAFVHYQRNEVGLALGDLRRALALDPSNFKALDGLSQVLREIGENKAALAVLRRLLDVHPHWPGTEKAIEELAREVEGQAL
jgi:tetratricopeptide (TPR) repeat protein